MDVLGVNMSKKLSRDEGLAWEVCLQGLDVTSHELVHGARKEYKNPLTLGTSNHQVIFERPTWPHLVIFRLLGCPLFVMG